MRTVKSELKKILKNRVIFIALAVFIALNLFNIYRNYNMGNGVTDGYVSGRLLLAEQLDGEITEEKTNLVNSKVSYLREQLNGEFAQQTEPDSRFATGYAYEDVSIWIAYRDYIDRAEYYSESFSAKLDTALKNAEYYSGKNEFYSRENKLYYNTYSGRQITEVYDTDRLINYFDYSLSSVLTVIILLLGVIPVFCSECECDMDTILLTSPGGRRKTVNSKIISSLLFSFAVTLLFSVCDFAGFMIFDKLDGLNQYVYAVQLYENVPLNIKVWQFILLMFAMRAIGMCILSLVFLLFSRLFKKSAAPFVCGVAVFFAMMLCKVFLTNHTGQIINILNPITFLTSYNIFSDFNVMNIFGQPVFTWQIMIIAGLLLIIALYTVIAVLPLKLELKVRRAK